MSAQISNGVGVARRNTRAGRPVRSESRGSGRAYSRLSRYPASCPRQPVRSTLTSSVSTSVIVTAQQSNQALPPAEGQLTDRAIGTIVVAFTAVTLAGLAVVIAQYWAGLGTTLGVIAAGIS